MSREGVGVRVPPAPACLSWALTVGVAPPGGHGAAPWAPASGTAATAAAASPASNRQWRTMDDGERTTLLALGQGNANAGRSPRSRRARAECGRLPSAGSKVDNI